MGFSSFQFFIIIIIIIILAIDKMDGYGLINTIRHDYLPKKTKVTQY